MSTRHLMALDYTDYHANGILKKHAKNRPLGNIEQRHNYIPPQPVLSCRTVAIDLPGTRTYRPKSTVDILQEQQKLIRQLYNKQRASVSAPPHQRTDPGIRSHSDNTRPINIEVKGRPLTSSSLVQSSSIPKINLDSHKRPRTTAGRLKNVKPATDTFMVIKVDKDLLETSRNNRQLTNQIHSYWKSENNNLAVGKFVRGQKRPDDVPPTLDAWLTFGGAAGDESQGVIDAFTSFKNSEEYYNIEGGVGSRVAQQLQKGDKIRIGINGILQSHDLKVKKWQKDSTTEKTKEVPEEEKSEPIPEIPAIPVADNSPRVKLSVPNDETDDVDDTFKELRIDDALEDLFQDEPVEEPENQMETGDDQLSEDGRESPPTEIVPLSWDDQCHKPDVKVINARPMTNKGRLNANSETHPVKFERLISNGGRPRLCDYPKENGFKVKQRSSTLKDKKDGRTSASKIKVVYIDPLDKDEDQKVDTLSVEEIISNKVNSTNKAKADNVTSAGLNKTNHALPSDKSNESGVITINQDTSLPLRSTKLRGIKSGHRGSNNSSRPSSNSSDRGITITSPKLKTIPVNLSHQSLGDNKNLSITTPAARHSGPISETVRVGKSAGRISPSKSLHRSVASSGSSIKSGPMSGETEYIKITSQLRAPASESPLPPNVSQPYSYQSFNYQPGRNTPRDGAYSPYDDENMPSVFTTYADGEQVKEKVLGNATRNHPILVVENGDDDDNKQLDDDDNVNDLSVLSESPAPTTVAISIPTADELSDRDSLSNSPCRQQFSDDDMTTYQKRERHMREEQIGQLTDLLGNAVVND